MRKLLKQPILNLNKRTSGALKDWKKMEAPIAGNFLFENIKNTNRLSGFRNYPHKNYSIKLWVNMSEKWNKNFKTKSQALKFAKSYMRKH